MKKNRIGGGVNSTKRGDAVFQGHFRSVYGDRWESLAAAMTGADMKVALMSKHCSIPKDELMAQCNLAQLDRSTIDVGVFDICVSADRSKPIPPPPKDPTNIMAYYIFDVASLAPVLALQVGMQHNVLDMCAAPGGKSVALGQIVSVGSLACNEPNASRRKRLQTVLREHLSIALMARVTVHERDATRWHAPGKYDRVLLDAACSAERHLMNTPSAMDFWTPLEPKRQSDVQRKMLFQALETVRPDGGRVVYSTCSISHEENDDVIEHVLARLRFPVVVLSGTESAEASEPPLGSQYAEVTKYGWMYQPDRGPHAWGPMFVAVLQRGGATAEEDNNESDDGEECGSNVSSN